MSKKQNQYYYSFTSQASSVSSLPAPPFDTTNVSHNANPAITTAPPPPYEDAIGKVNPTVSFSGQQPPAKTSDLIGYVRDQSVVSPSSSSATTPHGHVSTTSNYGNEDQEPLLDSYDGQQDHQLINIQQEQTPTFAPYHAVFEANQSGLVSRDRHLNQDGEALAQFLQQHNTPPHMKIRFYGYHDAIYYKSKRVCDKDGNWKERHKPVTKRVVDFDFDLDCSDAVSPQCLGMYVLPHPKTAQINTVRRLCDDYLQEPNAFKELNLTKVVNWDYAKLTQALTTAIRAHGYYHSVDISYELTHHTITIKADSNLSKMADHCAVRWFAYVTCLFIVTWPYLWISRKKLAYLSMKSEWKMKCTEGEWYSQHIQQVLCQIPPMPPYTNPPSIE